MNRDIYVSIAGTDLVRLEDGRFVVLEDNLRVPSGVSYMIANRAVMKRVFPTLFDRYKVAPVARLRPGAALDAACTRAASRPDPTFVVLTPGVGNSAYFEHAFLAREMGIPLVEGCDLLVHDNIVYMRTTAGLRRVDVIYRRVDDDFLDPLAFRADSQLGVPGLLNAYRAGNVALANAIGTGSPTTRRSTPTSRRSSASTSSEEPILDNVQTYLLDRPADRAIRPGTSRLAGREGGRRVGRIRHADRPAQHGRRARRVPAEDSGRAAQLHRAAHAVVVAGRRASLAKASRRRHVDLRPYVLYGDKVSIVPGGLTRVALRKGSLVVNSSQGGGSKDTWVLEDLMLLSRAADALYWLSRYLERAEHSARLVSVRLDLGLDRRPEIDGWDFHRPYREPAPDAPEEMPATPAGLVRHAVSRSGEQRVGRLPA